MTWSFNTDDAGVIHLMAVMEDDDTIGDAHETVKPGGSFCGVPYEALHLAESGEVIVDDDGHGRIV